MSAVTAACNAKCCEAKSRSDSINSSFFMSVPFKVNGVVRSPLSNESGRAPI